jgi:dihydroorotate dehydrogenase electron transfer subunit
MLVDVEAVVQKNTRLSSDYNVVAIAAQDIAAQALPGQFVMVKPRTGHDSLLRRPFSIFEVLRDNAGNLSGLSLLNKQIGVTTRALFNAKPGDSIQCLGPLGRPFSLPGSMTQAWMVAGGVGVAPFLGLAAQLRAQGVTTTLFYGGRHAGELFYLDAFRQLGVTLHLATDDGSAGDHGLVTLPLSRALQQTPPTTSAQIYACGPTRMMHAVTKLASTHDRPVEVSLEQIMGCGLGGCYSCVVPVRSPGGMRYVRSCLDGPTFDGTHVVWDQIA